MKVVINNLLYDTEKMELISEKIKHRYTASSMLGTFSYDGKDVKLYKSKKGNWLLTWSSLYENYAKALSENEARSLLMKYDIEAYIKIFGDLEEA